jgi:hypothetical protein
MTFNQRSQSRTVVMLIILVVFLAPILARALIYAVGNNPRSWRDADWSSTGVLPAASDFQPARIIVFTGTAGAWKGVFSVHSWIVLKRANETRWTRYDVVGWGNPVRVNNWPVDGRWYGNLPVILADIAGPEAERLIPRIEETVKAYDYAHAGDYRIWPGPNSNSFIAAVLRATPELRVILPPNAVGRDFRDSFYAGRTDSGTGRRGRSQSVGSGCRLRPASSGYQVARLRPYRHRTACDNRRSALKRADLTAICPAGPLARMTCWLAPWQLIGQVEAADAQYGPVARQDSFSGPPSRQA